MTQKIAIIGGGFSGVMVAIHLLQKANHSLQIYLIERRNQLGEGIAYSTPLDHHLLNVPAGKMSAFVDQHDNFLQWMNIHYPDKLITDKTFVTRKFYSEYLRSILQDAEQKARAGVLFYRVLDEAIAIDKTPSNLIITLKVENNYPLINLF